MNDTVVSLPQKAIKDHIKELASQHTEAAIKALNDIIADRRTPPSVRVAACKLIIERSEKHS